MTPGYYKLQVYRGDTTRWRFVVWEDDAKTLPYDLTGVAVTAELRSNPDGVLCASLGCTVTLPNTIDAVLEEADSALTVNGVWDLQLRYASGDVLTILAGAVSVTPDVTRVVGSP